MLIAEAEQAPSSVEQTLADLQPESPSPLPEPLNAPAVAPENASTDATEKIAAQPGVFSDLISLSKPRIVVMILVTTVATALVGTTVAGTSINALDWLALMLGTAGVAASAGAANQIWERVIDCGMPRTAVRPLPSQRMTTSVATAFAIIVGVAGAAALAMQFGWLPAAVGVATWILYVLVYTPMKVRTQWNTTVGAIAGALPVLIGYTATGGGLADGTGWLLFGILAAWQYPHFMAIAWLYRKQYAEAGFKMTTTEEPTGQSAGVQAIAGSLVILACGLWLCFAAGFDVGGVIAAVLVTVFTWPILKASIVFMRSRDDQTARKMLRASLMVLPLVLLVVTVRVLT